MKCRFRFSLRCLRCRVVILLVRLHHWVSMQHLTNIIDLMALGKTCKKNSQKYNLRAARSVFWTILSDVFYAVASILFVKGW